MVPNWDRATERSEKTLTLMILGPEPSANPLPFDFPSKQGIIVRTSTLPQCSMAR